jgi:hypothetical protein
MIDMPKTRRVATGTEEYCITLVKVGHLLIKYIHRSMYWGTGGPNFLPSSPTILLKSSFYTVAKNWCG